MKSLKTLREKKKMSQENIATALGVSVPTVSRWESEEFMPRADKLPDIAKVLECKIEDLF